MKSEGRLICFGTFSVDVIDAVVYQDDIPVKLGPIAVRLLIALLERHGEEVTFDELRAAGWPQATVVEVNTIYVHISNIRKALGDSYVVKCPRGYSFNPNTPVDRRAQRLDTAQLVSLQSSTPEPATKVSRARQGLLPLSLVLAMIAAVGAGLFFYRFAKSSRGQPSRFAIDGRLLEVSDEHNRRLWEFVFPKTIAVTKVSDSEGWAASAHEFIDLKRDGNVSLLIGINRLLYCFRSDGSVAWTYAPGRQTSTLRGQTVPAGYDISLVGALGRPRPDGGQIIVGAHKGGGALFVVEILTRDGKKVAEYIHFGWFFGLKVGTLGQGEREDIFFGGVDDVAGNAPGDYGATLVVLDPNRVEGQASTLIGDGRSLKDIPPAHEKAVLLLKEFAQNPDPNRYCRIQNVDIANHMLELHITQGEGDPLAWFRLNQDLRLDNVTPELFLLSTLRPTILRNVPPDQWGDTIKDSVGEIRYVRNEFEQAQ